MYYIVISLKYGFPYNIYLTVKLLVFGKAEF